MSKYSMVALAAAFTTALFSAAPSMADVTLTTEEYPPFNMTYNGQITGISTDLVKAMFEKAGVAFHIEMLPWNRAYQMALGQADTCVYSTTMTPERKDLFQWVGPLVNNDWVLFGAAAGNLSLSKLDDARDMVIGGYTGDAISIYLEKAGYRVENAPRDELNVPKLVNGRIELWATGSALGPFLAQQQGVGGAIKPLLTFKTTEMGLACNKGMAPDVLEKLRAALAEVRKP